MEKVAPSLHAVTSNLVGAEYQAGDGISRVAHLGHVSPRIGRVARVDSDRITVDAAGWLVGLSFGSAAAGVAQDQLVGRERDGFADRVRGHALGQGGRCRVGGLIGGSLENGVTQVLDPRGVGLPSPERLSGQVILVQEFGQDDAGLVRLGRVLPVAFALDAIVD
ncbi:MAG TPA: hypothetical protein VHS97_23785 [Isosphaeraceae bacterium]|nr:hypothetical protein [Isosphaeraceae bacterium]